MKKITDYTKEKIIGDVCGIAPLYLRPYNYDKIDGVDMSGVKDAYEDCKRSIDGACEMLNKIMKKKKSKKREE